MAVTRPPGPTKGGTTVDVEEGRASATLEAWTFVKHMLDEMTDMVLEDAHDEHEVLEGLRLVARVSALCSELSLDGDPAQPWFTAMNTPARFVGGPDPHGDYQIAMIDGTLAYRIRGRRGSSCYLGFQVLAGQGLAPRTMAAHLSDRDLRLGPDGSFELVVSHSPPTAPDDAQWLGVPLDASAVVVRQFFADRGAEEPAQFDIEVEGGPDGPTVVVDTSLAEQFTAMGWTIAKLATLHRTILPELRHQPNRLVTAPAASIGSENTSPDNLYMVGMFELDGAQALVIDVEPPDTRYWSLTLENVWHECFDVHRGRSSCTTAGAVRRLDGSVRFVVSGLDPGVPNWLDTGQRRRGFMVFRWLDNPSPPPVGTRVVSRSAVADLD
jgi:hypothetical protein